MPEAERRRIGQTFSPTNLRVIDVDASAKRVFPDSRPRGLVLQINIHIHKAMDVWSGHLILSNGHLISGESLKSITRDRS